MRVLPLTLAALLLLVQVGLWAGRGSLPYMLALRADLAAQLAANEKSRLANERLAAEVIDLKTGLETVEEQARHELGMVRPDELLVVVVATARH